VVLRLPPFASDMARSLRGLGYSTATAVADIVDNSLSARASKIDVDFEWRNEAPYVLIVDNGCGMNRERLIAAMRLGSDPRNQRAVGDLGRYGLGLKTASLSQATILTVVSKEAGAQATAARWDLARIEATSDWELWEGPPAEIGVTTDKLDASSSGTTVRWDQLDRLLGAAGDVDNFFAIAESVGQHLAMTFHRMLSAEEVAIKLNGVPLVPWNPVAEDVCDLIDERGLGPEGRIICRAYTMAAPAKLTDEQERRAAGPQDWIQQQGFYVYRERRLIVGGGWLGLGSVDRPWRFDAKYNLARLTIDITNADDQDWAIDLRKASAEPPVNCRAALLYLAKRARRAAVTRSRKSSSTVNSVAALATESEIPIWLPGSAAATAPFRVNRRHPLVSRIRTSMRDTTVLRSLLDLIERTAPLQPISSTMGIDIAVVAARELREADIRRLLLVVYQNYRRVLKLSRDEACSKLLEQPHFLEHRELVLTTVETLERDIQGLP
jgi:hypothetical protein